MPSTNGHGPKRAILYARVSTEEQACSGYSLAQQIGALREYTACVGHEVLEQEANALLVHYASMFPEALDALTSEERHRIYEMMHLDVTMYADGLAEVTGVFDGLLDTQGVISVGSERTSRSTATSRT